MEANGKRRFSVVNNNNFCVCDRRKTLIWAQKPPRFQDHTVVTRYTVALNFTCVLF